MTFNSVSFFAFFPLAVLVCWLVPRRWQNAALLAVSYAFYCFNTPAWLPVLVLDSLATWALVRRMDAAEGLSRKRRLWAALGVNLGVLVLLKGASLLLHGAAVSAGLWQALSRLGLASEAGGSAFSVILPLGIAAVAVVFSLLVSVIAVLGSLVVAGVVILIVGIALVITAFLKLFLMPAAALYLLGGGLACTGIGLAMTAGMIWLVVKVVPVMCRGFVNLCRWPFTRRNAA